MAPEAVDPGIAAGFHAADQQSYLQQILQNTRASQQNEQQLQMQKDRAEATVPTAGLHPAAAAFGTPNPDGTTSFGNVSVLNHALTQGDAARTREQNIDQAKGYATDILKGAITKGQPIGPDDPLYPHIQAAFSGKPVSPETLKTLTDYGKVHGEAALGTQGYDQFNKPLGQPNMPQGGGAGGADTYTEPGWVKDAKDQGHEVTRTVDKMTGLSSYSVKDAPLEGNSLQAFVKANYGGRSINSLSQPELKQARADWVTEQRANKVGTALTINAGKQEQAANGPLKPKELADFFNPQTKTFAVNDPAMRGADPAKLQQSGYLHTSAWGTSKDMVAEIQNVNTADAHLGNIRQFIDRNPDLYPNFDAQHPLSGAAAAHVQQVWRGILDGSDPRIAELKALDRSSLNILAAIAPPKNMRSGYSLLRYASEGLVNPSAVMSHQGALANIQGWENSVKAAAKGRLTAVDRSGAQVPTDIDRANTSQVSPGVSGGPPSVADWLKTQGGPK